MLSEQEKNEARAKVAELVADYRKQFPNGPSRSFNEENTKGWIDDLFSALGWKIRNDVVKEERAGKGKRVDYSFKIDGTTQFLLEAKKPSEKLDDHITQAITYGYQNSKRWVILTNFEEIRVYNSEYWKQPEEVKRLFSPIKISEFADRFEDLWILSKQGFRERLIEQLAKKYGKTKPSEPITKLLAEDLTRWRTLLTKNVNEHKRLNQLSADSKEAEEWIDEAVQRIIDRILFIRVAECRGVEEPILEQVLKNWQADRKKPLVTYLKTAFRHMDETYNSGLFHEHSSEDLAIDDKIMEQVIQETYTSPSGLPYDFAAIDADILGSVYEQYLSVLIRKTPKRASLKKNEAHRKEQGIYYTPTYIVDYIVRNTLGEMLKGKKPEEADKIKVLDMACGSGSFLLKAFDVLDEYYKQNDKNYSQTKLDTEHEDAKISRKTRILKNNIHGVDLDPKAVEIAQLNLLLKAAERKHRLPDLRENIKCGNSLIDDPAIAGEKAFNWNNQFEKITKDGGFDVIIGNPPWLMAGYYAKKDIDYLHSKYDSASGKFDMYYCFIEKSLSLLADGGLFGMIIPNKFFHTRSAAKLREILAASGIVHKIVDFGCEQIFEGATNYSCILVLQKGNKSKQIEFAEADIDLHINKTFNVAQSALNQKIWHFEDSVLANLFNKLEKKGAPLEGMVSRFGTGIQTGADKIFIINDQTPKSIESSTLKTIIKGKDVRKYFVQKRNRLIFTYKIEDDAYALLTEDELKEHKNTWTFLEQNKGHLAHRLWFGKNATQLSGKWYGLMYLDKLASFEAPHLLTPSLSDKSNFALGTGDLFVTGTAGVTSIIFNKTQENLLYFLGLLNSSSISYYILRHSPVFQGGYHKFSANYLKSVPIKRINFADSVEKQVHNEIVNLVKRAIDNSQKLAEIRTKQTDESHKLESEIKSIGSKIDQLVYDLYGLSVEERRVVEEAVK